MRTFNTLLIAAPVAFGLLAAPAAHAEWRNHGGGYDRHGGYERHHDHDNGNAVAGALLGLGIGALVVGAIASQPPAYAAPPPVVYAPPPPPYYPVPGYYAAPNYAPAPN